MLYSLILIVVLLLSFVLSYVVLKSEHKGNFKFIFFFFIIFVIWWQFTELLMQNSSEDKIVLLSKINYTGVIFVPILLYHFTNHFHSFKKNFLYFLYAIGIIFEWLLWTSDDFINGFHRYDWGVHPSGGYIHNFFVFFTLAIVSCILVGIYRKWKDQFIFERKQQFKLVFFATAIFSTAALDFIPKYGIDIFPVGSFFILAFLLIMFYATSKYNLISGNSFSDRVFVILSISIFTYVFWHISFFVEEIKLGSDFLDSAMPINIIIIPFFVFFSIELYKKISKFSQEIFKTFDKDKHFLNILSEIPNTKKEISIYLSNKFSIIFNTNVFVFTMIDGEIFMFTNIDSKENKNLFFQDKKTAWESFSARNKFTVLKEQKLKSIMPNSHRDDFIDILNKNKIGIFVPIKSRDIFVLISEKTTQDVYSSSEIKFLREISEKI